MNIEKAVDHEQWYYAREPGHPLDAANNPITKTVLDAARLVANPNLKAARESVDMAGLTLLLWRIMELMGVPVAEFPKTDRTGFAMMIRDSIVNKELIAAALTPMTDAQASVHESGDTNE